MEIYLAHAQGFCAGVARAIEIVDKVLKKYGIPLFVFHEIVHNTFVVEGFKSQGVQFVDDINDVPDGARIIFSAHGVEPSVVARAKEKKLHFIDATCPLVETVHRQALKLSAEGTNVVLIGHREHQEIIGTKGYVDPKLLHIVENLEDIDNLPIDTDKGVGYVTQTTLSPDDTSLLVGRLKERFPKLIVQRSNDICYATQNRQDAVKELCKVCDIVIICGSSNSSNSNRLKETAQKLDVESFLIDSVDDLDMQKLSKKERIGISSGASVPSSIVFKIVSVIQNYFSVKKVHSESTPEAKIVFVFPEI
ncbi:MAG: 4-hydroxy-3-methylbut-2-enyl diphosphate reductase [Candidatus Aceula meridiana]|nr:4-hydroxy-3-methylbut-2-enyl diphosphate reductase [Candidatus Aceula meridiana]